MTHFEKAVLCPACHGTFIVEYAATEMLTLQQAILVSSPCCVGQVKVMLPVTTVVFCSRPAGARSLLGRRTKGTNPQESV